LLRPFDMLLADVFRELTPLKEIPVGCRIALVVLTRPTGVVLTESALYGQILIGLASTRD
jgi:hypothetical protein